MAETAELFSAKRCVRTTSPKRWLAPVDRSNLICDRHHLTIAQSHWRHLQLAKIKPAVAATTYTGERTPKNYAFVDAVARKNVELTMSNIRKDSPVLAEMESHGTIKIVGAMYNLETGVVEFFTG